MNCLRILQLLLTIKTASAMRLHIQTKGSQIITRSGQTLTLPCVAKGKNFDSFANPVIWYKVAHNGEEFQINTGAVISTPFAETGRYGVDPQLDFDIISTVGMPLGIKNLTLAENGTYRCELRSRSKVLSSIIHQVVIIGPITKLELTSPDQHFNNKTKRGTFVFYENEPSTVTCDFVGFGPPSAMHVIRGDVDITPLFVRTESVKLVGEPGLQYAMYHIEYKSTKLKMEKAHNGATLYCTAQKPTFTELSLTKTALINVLYAAQFSCDTELLATVGEVDLEISCRITANPPVEVNNVWWTFSRREWNLTNGQSRDEFSSHIELKDGAVLATLTIANVSNSSFQTYQLTAQTKLAKRQHAIILEEEIPTTLAPTTISTTVGTTTTSPTTTSTATSSPVVTQSTTVSSTSADLNTGTRTAMFTTAKPVQAQTISMLHTLSNVPATSTTLLATTHKRRKHGKHKHKGKKKHRGQQSSSKGLKTTTVSTFTTPTKLIKVQKPTQISKHKNKTSENKTVDKHDTPSDVQYTIIDEPVKLNNASSALRLHITSYFGFILFFLCAVLIL